MIGDRFWKMIDDWWQINRYHRTSRDESLLQESRGHSERAHTFWDTQPVPSMSSESLVRKGWKCQTAPGFLLRIQDIRKWINSWKYTGGIFYCYFRVPKTTTTAYKTDQHSSGFTSPRLVPPRYSKDNGPLDNVKTPEDVRAEPWPICTFQEAQSLCRKLLFQIVFCQICILSFRESTWLFPNWPGSFPKC